MSANIARSHKRVQVPLGSSRFRETQRMEAARTLEFTDEHMASIEMQTSRFGPVAIEPDDVIYFPGGMLGLDGCLHWVLLADADNDALGWLQCVNRAEVALAVVSPRRFVPDYQIRVARSELGPLGVDPAQGAHVLVILSKYESSITLNLKAPLLINLERRVGKQVIAGGDQPVQFELQNSLPQRRKSA